MIVSEIIETENGLTANFGKYYPIHNQHILSLLNLVNDFLIGAFNNRGIHGIMFYNLFKNDLILAYLSITRKHQSQFAWNIRKAIESGVQTAYCFQDEVKDIDKYINKTNTHPNEKFRDLCNEWLKKNYYSLSTDFENLHNSINSLGTHSGLENAHASVNMPIVINNIIIEGYYFDKPNDEETKMNLLILSFISIEIVKLLGELNKSNLFFETDKSYEKRLSELEIENEKLNNETKSSEYYKELLRRKRIK